MEPCEIVDIEDKITRRPVLLNYENGIIQPDKASGLYPKVFESSKGNVFVTTTYDEMTYTGKIGSEKDLYNSFIGVRDKQTNTMRLIAVDTVTLSAKIIKSQKIKSPAKASAIELNKQFGSKRVKRQIEQKLRFKVDAENVKDHLKKTIEEVDIQPQDMVTPAYNENESTYKPPINRDAKSVEEVYDLNTLIPEEIIKTLKTEVKSVIKNEEYKFHSQHITILFSKFRSDGLSKKDKKFRVLLYVDYLLKFLSTPMKNFTKTFQLCTSPVVNEHIIQNYTIPSKQGRQRPFSMRDKLLCSILVLLMLACDYHLNLANLTGELKMGIKKLQEMSRILGFNTSGNTCLLKLPLPPVVTSRYSKKRKRT